MDKARSFPYDEGRKDGMPMEIGAKLRQARIAAGLTQEQTAEALGVSRQSISNWENFLSEMAKLGCGRDEVIALLQGRKEEEP